MWWYECIFFVIHYRFYQGNTQFWKWLTQQQLNMYKSNSNYYYCCIFWIICDIDLIHSFKLIHHLSIFLSFRSCFFFWTSSVRYFICSSEIPVWSKLILWTNKYIRLGNNCTLIIFHFIKKDEKNYF